MKMCTLCCGCHEGPCVCVCVNSDCGGGPRGGGVSRRLLTLFLSRADRGELTWLCPPFCALTDSACASCAGPARPLRFLDSAAVDPFSTAVVPFCRADAPFCRADVPFCRLSAAAAAPPTAEPTPAAAAAATRAAVAAADRPLFCPLCGLRRGDNGAGREGEGEAD